MHKTASTSESSAAPGARLFWVVFAASAYLALGVFARQAHPHADDAFIYFRVAANVLAGAGPVFNVGDGHMPVTSPLWLYLLCGCKWLAPGLAFPQIAKLLSGLALAGACTFAALLLRRHERAWAGLAPLAVVFNAVVFRSAGLEIPLTYLTVLATLWAFQEKKHPVLVGVLLALAYLSRGESVLLGPLMALAVLWDVGRGRTSGRDALRSLLATAAAAGAVAVAWHAYYYHQLGALVPETLHAKMLQGESGGTTLYSERLWARLNGALRGRGVVLALVGFATLLPKVPLLFAWPLVHFVAYSLLGVAFYNWYYYDLELVVAVSALFGAVRIVRWTAAGLLALGKRFAPEYAQRPRVRAATSVGLAWVGLALYLPSFAQVPIGSPRVLAAPNASAFVAWDPSAFKTRERIYSKAAAWLNEQDTSPDERVVFVKEIGVLGFYAPSYEIRDMSGLASRASDASEILNEALQIERHTPRYIFQSVGPNYLARRLGPPPEEKRFELTDGTSVRFRLVHRVMLTERRLGGCWYERDDAWAPTRNRAAAR